MKHTNRRKGAAAAELALMMGILMLILVGTIDLGRVFYSAVTVDDASRAGAQWGIRSNGFSGDSSGIHDAAADNAEDLATVASSSERVCLCEGSSTEVDCITGTCTAGVGVPQVYVRVTTETTFNTLFDYPGVPHVIPLSNATTFRVQ